MDAASARQIVDKHFSAEATKAAVLSIARTPTPQTELYEREPKILRAIRNLYRPAFEAAGCETWIDDYGNLIASQGEGSGPHVLFYSCAMAWAEGTMPNPWSGELMSGERFGVEGEVVWGRGGSEYLPSNAANIECARMIHESGVRVGGKITYVVSSAGHTSSSDPVYHLVHNDQLTADLCIMCGGPKAILLGNMGRLDLRVNVFGKSVHSGGELKAGINAIEGGLQAIERVRKIMPFPPKGMKDPDMGQGRLSIIGLASYPFSPGYHEGVGSGGHTLQNLMRFMLDRRLPPGQDVQAAIDEIKEAIGDMTPYRITYERGALQYPSKHTKDSPIVKGLAAAFRAALGVDPSYTYVDYTVDAGYWNMVGVPTIFFGANDMRFAHGDTEFTNLNDTYDLAKVHAVWALMNAA